MPVPVPERPRSIPERPRARAGTTAVHPERPVHANPGTGTDTGTGTGSEPSPLERFALALEAFAFGPPNVALARDAFLGRANAFPPRVDAFTPRANAFPPRVDAFTRRANAFPPRVDAFVGRANASVRRTKGFVPPRDAVVRRPGRLTRRTRPRIPSRKESVRQAGALVPPTRAPALSGPTRREAPSDVLQARAREIGVAVPGTAPDGPRAPPNFRVKPEKQRCLRRVIPDLGPRSARTCVGPRDDGSREALAFNHEAMFDGTIYRRLFHEKCIALQLRRALGFRGRL